MKRTFEFMGVKPIYPIFLICSLYFIGCSENPSDFTIPVQVQDETSLKSENTSSRKKILFLDNFQDGDSRGWELLGDGWSIETEADNYVLCSSTGNHFAFATLQHPGWHDFRFKSRVKFVNGITYCELLFRIDDLHQHYWLQVWHNFVAIAKEGTTGEFETLASTPMSIIQNTWYDFEIAAIDNKIKVKIDGSPKINLKDNDPWGNIGTIGFEIHDNSQVYFDDILVTRLGSVD